MFHPSHPFGMAAFGPGVRQAANVGFLADTARQFATHLRRWEGGYRVPKPLTASRPRLMAVQTPATVIALNGKGAKRVGRNLEPR